MANHDNKTGRDAVRSHAGTNAGHQTGGSHPHSHSHGFAPAQGNLGRAFIIGIALNLVFVAAEFLAGFVFDSMALLSDAGHNLSDVVGLALAMLAFRLAGQKPTMKYTYGRKRSTILVSLVNAVILLFVVAFILSESIEKLYVPQPVQGGAIAWVAGIGIVVNGFTAWLFMRHRKTDMNVEGAFLHMVADALVSLGVVISGVVISFTGWYPLDPVIGIIIAVVIFVSTWGLLRDSLKLSLDGVPPGIDRDAVEELIKTADADISDVHHLHIWAISTTENALTAHVVLRSAERAEEVKAAVKLRLRQAGISHSTLELELSGEACCDGPEACGNLPATDKK